jgi:hypothetical protein
VVRVRFWDVWELGSNLHTVDPTLTCELISWFGTLVGWLTVGLQIAVVVSGFVWLLITAFAICILPNFNFSCDQLSFLRNAENFKPDANITSYFFLS